MRNREGTEDAIRDMFTLGDHGNIYYNENYRNKIGALGSGGVEIIIQSPFLHDGLAEAVGLGLFCQWESIPSVLRIDYKKVRDIAGSDLDKYMKDYIQFFQRALYRIDRDKSP